jgi:hypothetical protein
MQAMSLPLTLGAGAAPVNGLHPRDGEGNLPDDVEDDCRVGVQGLASGQRLADRGRRAGNQDNARWLRSLRAPAESESVQFEDVSRGACNQGVRHLRIPATG